MKAPLASMLLLHTVFGLASPTNNIGTRQAVAAERTRLSSSTTSYHHHHGQDAATTSPAAYGFLVLVESWQHRRASGYYVLADACGDVITVYHDPSHVRLAGCHVTQCTEALRDGEAEAVRTGAASSSTTTWCNGSAVRSADSATSLLGHLRCLATLPQRTQARTPGVCRTCRQVVMEKRVPYRGQTAGRCHGQSMKRPQRQKPSGSVVGDEAEVSTEL